MGNPKFCKKCGSKLEEDSVFCTECGEKVSMTNEGQAINEVGQSSFTYKEPDKGGQYIPYSHNQHSSGTGIQGKKKSNAGIVIGIIAGVIVVAALVFVAMKFMGGKPGQSTNVPANKSEAKAGVKTESKPVTKEESKPQAKKVDTSDPMSYLPKLYMKYIYEKIDDTGKTEKAIVVTGRNTDFVLLSLVEFPEDAKVDTENQFAYRAKHIKKGVNSIDTFSDGDFYYFGKEYNIDKLIQWLPGKVKSGTEWKDKIASYKITEAGVECDLGFEKLKDCIVIESKGSSGVELSYIAPDCGTVMIKNKDSGKTLYKLTDMQSMGQDEANKIVGHFSVAMSTYVEKYYSK